MTWNWQLDGWIIAAGMLCAVASSLVGNFLVLRRLSMLGDAVSHAILPGLAVAFFISNSRSSLPMFFGAVIVGVLTALFTEWIRGIGKVDEGASMGVVFTSLFAAGLIMIVQAADKVDLDAGCVLYGAIEMTPLDTVTLFASSDEAPVDFHSGKLDPNASFAARKATMGNSGFQGITIPRAVLVLGSVTLINLLFVTVFFKELKLSSFDPALATSMGFSSAIMHYALMVLVAVTAVASFESVGNVLVVAMFIVPPATAYLLTDRLGLMIVLSTIIGAVGAATGHIAAVVVPTWFGYRSTTTAGMMAVMVGVLFAIALLFAPRHGIVVKFVRRQLLSLSILSDDIVALLYRYQEREHENQGAHGFGSLTSSQQIASELFASRFAVAIAISRLKRQGQLRRVDEGCELTAAGTQHARGLIRSHRLWEQYLVTEVDMDASRIHDKAERFEHFTDAPMQRDLALQTDHPAVDPHGREIPRDPNAAQ